MNPHDKERLRSEWGPPALGSTRRQGGRWAAVWPRASARPGAGRWWPSYSERGCTADSEVLRAVRSEEGRPDHRLETEGNSNRH